MACLAWRSPRTRSAADTAVVASAAVRSAFAFAAAIWARAFLRPLRSADAWREITSRPDIWSSNDCGESLTSTA
ncbi:Uncharacterised protein [Mycobacteroides abscessus subsp. abscessus]|nr:Uncharacterised protein [Mycobacteroides abscessus subsp. abscessus]